MKSEEINLYSSVSEYDKEIVSKLKLELNLCLSSKLSYLSRQIDIVPHDYTLKPLLKHKRKNIHRFISTDEEEFYGFNRVEDYLNKKECNLKIKNIKGLENNNDKICFSKYFPINNIIINNQKNQHSLNKLSIIDKNKINDSLNSLFINKQLGESFKYSNNEIISDSINSNYTLNKFSNLEVKKSNLVINNQHNNNNLENKINYFDFDYNNKENDLKESDLKIKILKEVDKLDKEKRCKITYLKSVMAKSNIDKISNHRDNQNIKYINKQYIYPNFKENMCYSIHTLSCKETRKYRLTGFLEFYKVNYMGLLEKYNQAKRAYSQTLPRMQMLEIQNNILFEIIGKIHAEDDGITNLLKEFIEIKSFCIHSIMKLKDELGDNYENILNLIIESNSTSEVRPWAKILSGMFNYYEIKVDDTLIQNLNTLYSINKMTQGS